VQATLATNTVAPLRLAQALLPLLRKKSRGGRSSTCRAVRANSAISTAVGRRPYSLSKAALNLVTRMLAPR